ncbi:luciferase family protein [Natrinema soli]|uniref:Luciferase family protein n=1 Tax=Natrinema soli TaxID=1930624 RepID=A0ABD5SM07_9EURY|nr:luciferase family protein [Natrinema soli]
MTPVNNQKVTEYAEQVIETVSSWPEITTGNGRFNSTTFQIEGRDIGHVHSWGPVDIGYPQPLRNQLVAEKHTEKHHVVPDSNATTFHIEAADDVEQAIVLLRLSYLYQILVLQKRGDGDAELTAIDVNDELAGMEMSEDIRTIFEDIRS